MDRTGRVAKAPLTVTHSLPERAFLTYAASGSVLYVRLKCVSCLITTVFIINILYFVSLLNKRLFETCFFKATGN